MLTAVATVTGNTADDIVVRVDFRAADGSLAPRAADEEGEEELPESDLNPIAPEVKEMAWGFGSFVVLAVLMRYFLYPRLRRGMDARYRLIEGGHEQAEQVTTSARNDVAEYERQVAAIKVEAQQRVEAARATLEAERAERLAEVNSRVAERRAAAATDVEAARAAAQSEVDSAVRAVAARAGQLATGREPDPDVVSRAVADVMSAGVSR